MQNEQTQDGHRPLKTHGAGARWFFIVMLTLVAIATAVFVGRAVASDDDEYGSHRWGHHKGGPAKLLFKQLDTDKDGMLKEGELRAGVAARIEGNDGNGDGALSLQEFEGVWVEFMRTAMVRTFQKLDEDGDAQLTAQELNEKIDWMMARLDRDGDGAIAIRELRRHRHHD